MTCCCFIQLCAIIISQFANYLIFIYKSEHVTFHYLLWRVHLPGHLNHLTLEQPLRLS